MKLGECTTQGPRNRFGSKERYRRGLSLYPRPAWDTMAVTSSLWGFPCGVDVACGCSPLNCLDHKFVWGAQMSTAAVTGAMGEPGFRPVTRTSYAPGVSSVNAQLRVPGNRFGSKERYRRVFPFTLARLGTLWLSPVPVGLTLCADASR